MGCNTSQELKTKEGSNTGVNGSAQNDDNNTCEQNTNNEDAQQQKGAVSGEQQTTQTTSNNSANHTNHSKTNSIISNGGGGGSADASHNQSSKSSANSKQSTVSPAKENGSLLKHQIQSYNKAELTEFKDMDDGEDEGEWVMFQARKKKANKERQILKHLHLSFNLI